MKKKFNASRLVIYIGETRRIKLYAEGGMEVEYKAGAGWFVDEDVSDKRVLDALCSAQNLLDLRINEAEAVVYK